MRVEYMLSSSKKKEIAEVDLKLSRIKVKYIELFKDSWAKHYYNDSTVRKLEKHKVDILYKSRYRVILETKDEVNKILAAH